MFNIVMEHGIFDKMCVGSSYGHLNIHQKNKKLKIIYKNNNKYLKKKKFNL